MKRFFKKAVSAAAILSLMLAQMPAVVQAEDSGGAQKYFKASYTFGETATEDEKTGGLQYTEAGLKLAKSEDKDATGGCEYKAVAESTGTETEEAKVYTFNPANMYAPANVVATYDSQQENIIFRGKSNILTMDENGNITATDGGDTAWGVCDYDGDGTTDSVFGGVFSYGNKTNVQAKPRIIFNGGLFPDGVTTQEIVCTFKYKGDFRGNQTSAKTTSGEVKLDTQGQTVFTSEPIDNEWKRMVIRGTFNKPTNYKDECAALFMCCNGTVIMQDIQAMTAADYDKLNSAQAVKVYTFDPNNIHYIDGANQSFDSSEKNILFLGKPTITYNAEKQKWVSTASGDSCWGVADENNDGTTDSVVAIAYFEQPDGNNNKYAGKPRMFFDGGLFPNGAETQEIVCTFKFKGNFRWDQAKAATTNGDVTMENGCGTVFQYDKTKTSDWQTMVIRATFNKPTEYEDNGGVSLWLSSNGVVYMKDITVMTAADYDKLNNTQAVNREEKGGESAAFTTKFYHEGVGVDGKLYFDMSKVTTGTAPFYATIRYFDNGTKPLKLSYIGAEGNVVTAEVARGGSDTWKTETIELGSAKYDGKFTDRNDNFCIDSNGQDTWIHSVTVSNASADNAEAFDGFVNDFEATVPDEAKNADGNIIDHFELPSSYHSNEVTWTSADSSLIEIKNDSKAVIHPSEDGTKEVKLKARMTLGGVYAEKEIAFTLAKKVKTSPLISNVTVESNDTTTTVSGDVSNAFDIGTISLIAVAKDAQGAITDTDKASFNTDEQSHATLTATVKTPDGETVHYYFVANNASLLNAPPSAPENFNAKTASGNVDNLELTWDGSADDFNNVTEYQITVNGTGMNNVTKTISADEGTKDESGKLKYAETFENLKAGETYSFALKAKDHAGEYSAARTIAVTTSKVVSYDFTGGGAGVGDGMEFYLVEQSGMGDGYTVATEVDGVKCRKGGNAGGSNWRGKFMFTVDNDIIPTTGNNIIFEVMYYDGFDSSKNLWINYNTAGSGNGCELVKGSGTKTWKTATVAVSDASLRKNTGNGKLGDGRDFQIKSDTINPDTIIISKVRVATQPVVTRYDTEEEAVLSSLGLMGNTDTTTNLNGKTMMNLIDEATGGQIAAASGNVADDAAMTVADAAKTYLSFFGLAAGTDVLAAAEECGLLFEENGITDADKALSLADLSKIAYNALFVENESCGSGILYKLMQQGKVTDAMLGAANDVKCEAYRYALGKTVKKETLQDETSGKTYYRMDLDGASAIRNYFNKQEWNAASTKFIFGNDVTGAMYEYDTEKEIVRFLEFVPSDGSLNAVVAPTDEIFYSKANGEIWRLDWKTYNKKKIAEIPAPYSNFGNLSVTDDGKYLSCMVRKVSGNAAYSGPLVLIDAESGRVDLTYSHSFNPSYDGIGHPIINPTNKNLLFFCHEGLADLVTDRMWVLDRSTGTKTNLTQTAGDKVGHESWGADGDDIYFVKYQSGSDKAGLGKVDVKTNTVTWLTGESDYSYWHCQPSYNEKYVVADTNSTPRELVLADTETGEETVLAKFKVGPSVQHPYQPHPTFSRDDKYVSWALCDEDNDLGIAWMDVSDMTQQ